MGAQQQLRQLPHPVVREPAADPLGRDIPDLRRPLTHLPQGVFVRARGRAVRRTAARARFATGRRGSSSGSSCGGRVARGPSGRSSGSSSSPVSRRRAIALIVKSRRRMSSSSEIPASATISKSCRPGPVDRSTRGGANSMPAGWSARAAEIARQEADTHPLVGDDEVLDAAVRLQRRSQLRVPDPGDHEVVLAHGQAEQLVPHGPADGVGVQAERMHVVRDRGPGLLRGGQRPRSRPRRPPGAWRPRTSTARAASRPRVSRRPRSCPRSRRGSGGRRSS